MRITDLTEAGVKTAKIDLETGRALDKVFERYFETELYRVKDRLGTDVHNAYEYIVQQMRDGASESVKIINNFLSAVAEPLTSIAKGYDKNFKALVMVREWTSEEDGQTRGGYYSADQQKIVVVVPLEKIKEGIIEGFYEAAAGDTSNDRGFRNYIKNVFVHEYAHMVQFGSGGWNSPNDHGYTSVKKDRWRRSTKTMADWIHYLGSSGEIDSFASDTVAGLHDEALKNNRGYEVSRDTLVQIAGDIAAGYSGESLTPYYQFVQKAFAGEFDELGLKKREAHIVWQRFLKLVYSKLMDYQPDVGGKSARRKEHPSAWFKWAEGGFVKTFQKLAYQCAVDSENEYDLSTNVRAAWSFLEKYFLGNDHDWEKTDAMRDKFSAFSKRMFDQQQDWLSKAA